MSIEREMERFEAAQAGKLDLTRAPIGYGYVDVTAGLMWCGWWDAICDMAHRTEREDWMS